MLRALCFFGPILCCWSTSYANQQHIFDLEAEETKIIIVDQLTQSVVISLRFQGETIFHSQSSGGVKESVLIVAGPYAESRRIEVTVRPVSQTPEYLPGRIRETHQIGDLNLELARDIQLLSTLKKQKSSAAGGHLESVLNKISSIDSYDYDLVAQLLSILEGNGDNVYIVQLLGVLNTKSKAFPSNAFQKRQFVRAKISLARSKSDFGEVISNQCELVSMLSSENDLFETYLHRYEKIVLANDLIEWVRNVPNVESEAKKLLENYITVCSGALKSTWRIAGVSLQDYQKGTRTPLDDVQVLLEDSSLQMEKWSNPNFNQAVHLSYWSSFNLSGQHEKAENSMRLAIEEALFNELDHSLPMLYQFLGFSLIRQGRFTEARHYLRKMLVSISSTQSGTVQEGDAFTNFGFLLKTMGDYRAAKSYFEQALRIYCELGQPIGDNRKACKYEYYAATALLQSGLLAREMGDIPQALKYHLEAELLFEDKDDYFELVAWTELAKDYLAQKNYEKSEEYIKRVIADNRPLTPQLLEAWLTSMQLGLEAGSSSVILESVSNLSELLGIKIAESTIQTMGSEEIEYARYRIQFFTLLVRYYAGLNEIEKIQLFAERAFNIIDKIDNQLVKNEEWKSAQYNFVSEYVNSLYQLNEPENNLGYEEIEQVLDRYYSIDHVRERNNYLYSTDGNLLSQQQKQLWNEKLAAEREILTADDEIKYQAVLKASLANDAFYASRSYRPLVANQSASLKISLKELQKTIPEEDIFVRYFIDEELSFALVVTKEMWYLKPLPDRESIRHWVGEIERNVNLGLRGALHSLPIASLLPDEIKIEHGYQRVVIVPDDVLHRIPFSSIAVGENQYAPSANNLQFVRTHSLRSYYKTVKTEQVSNEDSLTDITIFADPDFHVSLDSSSTPFQRWAMQLPRLQGSAVEANHIQSLLQDLPVKMRIAVGKLATNEFLLSHESRNSRILHIASHGFFDEDFPDLVGIVTAVSEDPDDLSGFLSLSEMLSQPFGSELVIVSGCETMLGEYYKGVGVRSITRGLLSQGVGSVVGTIWPIPDRPTAEFMKFFYQSLKENGDSAVALAYAKRQLSSSGRYRDPRYWGGFVLTSTNRDYEKLGFNFKFK